MQFDLKTFFISNLNFPMNEKVEHAGLVEKDIAYNYRDYFMVGECVRFLIYSQVVKDR